MEKQKRETAILSLFSVKHYNKCSLKRGSIQFLLEDYEALLGFINSEMQKRDSTCDKYSAYDFAFYVGKGKSWLR